MKTRNLLLIAMILVIAVPTYAQYSGGRYQGGGYRGSRSPAYEPGTIQISPYVGFMFGDDYDAEIDSGLGYGNIEQEDSATYGIRIGFGFAQNMGFELQFSHMNTEFNGSSGGGFFNQSTKLSDVDVYQILGNVNLDFSKGPIVPYMALGMGTTIYDFEQGGSESEFTGTMAGGFKSRLAPNMSLRLEVRGYVTQVQDSRYSYYYDGYYYDWERTNDDFLTTWEATVGLSFTL